LHKNKKSNNRDQEPAMSSADDEYEQALDDFMDIETGAGSCNAAKFNDDFQSGEIRSKSAKKQLNGKRRVVPKVFPAKAYADEEVIELVIVENRTKYNIF
jgi:hypothetical protein